MCPKPSFYQFLSTCLDDSEGAESRLAPLGVEITLLVFSLGGPPKVYETYDAKSLAPTALDDTADDVHPA